MKSILFIFLFFGFIVSTVNGQEPKGASPALVNELKSFIDTIKTLSVYKGKYNVYVVKLNREDPVLESNLSITFGYIMNDFSIPYTYFNYFFMFHVNNIINIFTNEFRDQCK